MGAVNRVRLVDLVRPGEIGFAFHGPNDKNALGVFVKNMDGGCEIRHTLETGRAVALPVPVPDSYVLKIIRGTELIRIPQSIP